MPSPPTARPTRVFVWKTVADPFAGRISLFRVVTGVARDDTTLTLVGKGAQERLGHLLTLQGKAQATGHRNCTPATSAPSPS